MRWQTYCSLFLYRPNNLLVMYPNIDNDNIKQGSPCFSIVCCKFFLRCYTSPNMLTIRLQRVGRTNDPNFRVVLIESKRAPRSGAFKEILGSYDPRHKANVKLKGDRIAYWISKGATTSVTVHNLLVGAKILEGKTKPMVPPPKAKVEEPVVAAATA